MAKIQMVTDGHLGGYVPGGDPGTWCPHLWNWIVREFEIRSVLDVGCGEGHSAKYFQDLGCEVTGVEGCQQALDNSAIPESLAQHDFCKGPYLPQRSFDMIWSCEFLEHVDCRYLANVLGTFAHAAKMILITHAFPGQNDGHHHVNCQPSSYWIRHIEALGFSLDIALSRKARTVTLRDYSGVNHFARSGLVFRRVMKPTLQTMPGEKSKGLLTGLSTQAHAFYRSMVLSTSFRWSQPYREQRRKRKQMKRAKRRFQQV